MTTLRRFLATQPTPSTSEPVTLPAPLLSLLLPYMADPLAAEPSGSSFNSVMVALTQRAKLLQEENDELYGLLRRSETGGLKEEVRGLRRAMRRMEGALTGEWRVRARLFFCGHGGIDAVVVLCRIPRDHQNTIVRISTGYHYTT